MSTKTEQKDQEEVIVLEALTEDQIKSLPETAVTKVTSLSGGDLPNKQLQIFIPVVQKYIELRDAAAKLKLKRDDDGKITKESIQEYKDVLALQRSFNGLNAKKIKEIKDPLNATKNDVISVEKTFKEESDKIKEAAKKEFAEYEEELQKKKDEAQAKKDAEMNAKIDEAKEEADRIKKQQEKTEVYNKIMYLEIGGNLRDVVLHSLDNSNIDALAKLKASIAQKTFEDICPSNVGILEEEVLQELEGTFDERKAWAIQKIDEKMDQIEKEEMERSMQRTREAYVPAPPIPQPVRNEDNGMQAPQPHIGTSDEEFIQKTIEQLNDIKFSLAARLKAGSKNDKINYLYNRLFEIKL